jgi:glycosyltransferase involved in cell wall biosynthesis
MAERRFRVLVLASHVVPYASPLFRLLEKDPRLDILIAYCSLQGNEPGLDPEFGVKVQWDLPLLDGYRWVHIPNRSLKPRLGSFFGLWNPGLWRLVRTGNFDAVVIYTGYMYASFWLTVLAAKSVGTPVLISIDSTTLQSREKKRWKEWLKPFIVRRVYSSIDVIMAASNASKKLAMQLGVREERIQIIRCGMDKEAWQEQNKNFDRSAIRAEWGIPQDAPIVLYCAKLQPWKRPLDLLEAFAKAKQSDAYLVFAGEGPQRNELESQVRALGVADQVRVLGFVNLSQLPGLYYTADLFVLPSDYDPCPLAVAEAMFSGLPVILSDAVLGRLEMIDAGKSGYVYPCGDIDSLARILRQVLGNPQELEQLKHGVARQMEAWTRQELLDCWVGAAETAVKLKPRS